MPPHEHDDDVVSPFRPSHVHEPWPYVCASRRSRPRPYVCTWSYLLSCTMDAVRTCTCYVCASTTTHARLYIHQYICTYMFTTRMTTLRMLRPGGSQQSGGESFCFFCPDALPCVRRCSWWVPAVRGANHFFARTHFLACEDVAGGSQQSGGKLFFMKYGCPFVWSVRWIPAVRWRNNYFPCNKEELPCGCRGPSCQPLHVQSTSDGSRSLTTPRREHQGGGR